MGEAAERTGARMACTPVLQLTDDTVADILLRLPAASVLRSGAVCKAWRRIITGQHFLAERARRQPVSVLLHTYLDAAPWPCGNDLPARGDDADDVALDALPVSSEDAAMQRLIRYPRTPLTTRAHCRLLSSCDGVLLFKKDMGYYLLCNPVTRQWADLPRLAGDSDEYCMDRDPEYAFYFHQPSGEFRLLCFRNAHRTWYIVSTGAAEPRHVDVNADADAITKYITCLYSTVTTPVALHGNLHWTPLRRSITGESKMEVFNTESETFHQMSGPPATTGPDTLVKLFEMERLLVAADFGEEKHVDLWFLVDYSTGRWERRHRVASPWKYGNGRPRSHCDLLSVAAAGDDEDNVILGNNDVLVVYDVRRRKTVRTVDHMMSSRACVSRHVFKGSLVQHASFFARPSADFPLIHSWS